MTFKDFLILFTTFTIGFAFGFSGWWYKEAKYNTDKASAKITRFAKLSKTEKTIPVNITVAHAGVKSEGMGYLCYSGYVINPKKPARICAISDDLRAFFPFFSNITIRSDKCPLINGKWMVVDRSTMSARGIEIYIPNANEVTFGGSWKGELILK